MQKLNLPESHFRVIHKQNKELIFDEFRRRWVALTPEEWVRQNFLKFLQNAKGFPQTLMAIEKVVEINGLQQRFDLLVYNRKGKPLLVAEFKAPDVTINQAVLDQAIRYNNSLMAPYILISNGMVHFVCQIDFKGGSAEYLKEIPEFNSLLNNQNLL
jgi:type I site-specific restriction endonuclease